MDLGLDGKTAVVLASTGGLGLAVARALAREGARVAISGRDPARLGRALAELKAAGGAAESLHGDELDVTDGTGLVRHLEATRERWGGVDVLVLNAGGPPPAAAADASDADLDRAFELTFKSAVRATRTVLPWMRERRFGRVIALTSLSVRQPIPDLVHSNAMRAALTGYLKTLASEVAADGVLVNTVCTGMFATDRLAELFEARARKSGRTPEEEAQLATAAIPVGRLGDPDELAELVAFLASERSSFLAGVSIPIDGGALRSLF